ncbi:hypothetical protein SPHINGOAX6_50227 [Sphingomonas sp. AX6]|nr:hypothetical protein SPHINGOAX6_50227 [Sphingomonas sp. AX6]
MFFLFLVVKLNWNHLALIRH